MAWKRTTLALAITSAFGARVNFEQYGWIALLVAAAGLFAAGLAYWLVNKRYWELNKRLSKGKKLKTSGAVFGLVATSTMLVSLLALWYLIG